MFSNGCIIQSQRIIRCGGPVDDDMANIIVSQLLYLDAVDPNKVRLVLLKHCKNKHMNVNSG